MVKLRKRILAGASYKPPAKSLAPKRTGDIPRAICKVLSRKGEPMRTTAIHKAVEKQLGRAVSYHTIKACLSREAQKESPRFERVACGEYQVAFETESA
jgi:hypothetical protein